MFRKKKNTHLIFHGTDNKQKIELFAPDHSMKLLPKWFHTISKKEDVPTMRTCPGFVDLYKRSISIPMWVDMTIIHEDGRIKDVDVAGISKGGEHEFVEQHHPVQWGDGFQNYVHVKLKAPWAVTCNNDTQFLMHDAIWDRDTVTYTVPPGILDFRYQSACQINMFLPRTKYHTETKIAAGTIIAYLTPMIDTKLTVEKKYVNREEWYSLQKYFYTLGYKTYHKTKKMLEGKQ